MTPVEWEPPIMLVLCCHCGAVYDAGEVHVVGRHADCSTWRSPCCGQYADDRVGLSLPHIRRLSREEIAEIERTLGPDGNATLPMGMDGSFRRVRVVRGLQAEPA